MLSFPPQSVGFTVRWFKPIQTTQHGLVQKARGAKVQTRSTYPLGKTQKPCSYHILSQKGFFAPYKVLETSEAEGYEQGVCTSTLGKGTNEERCQLGWPLSPGSRPQDFWTSPNKTKNEKNVHVLWVKNQIVPPVNIPIPTTIDQNGW